MCKIIGVLIVQRCKTFLKKYSDPILKLNIQKYKIYIKKYKLYIKIQILKLF